MADYRILAWHGIPTGVQARDESGQARVTLSVRFQATVDQVAAAVGHTDTKPYLAGWHWSDWTERAGSSREVADSIASELEDAYPQGRLKDMLRELKVSLMASGGANA